MQTQESTFRNKNIFLGSRCGEICQGSDRQTSALENCWLFPSMRQVKNGLLLSLLLTKNSDLKQQRRVLEHNAFLSQLLVLSQPQRPGWTFRGAYFWRVCLDIAHSITIMCIHPSSTVKVCSLKSCHYEITGWCSNLWLCNSWVFWLQSVFLIISWSCWIFIIHQNN